MKILALVLFLLLGFVPAFAQVEDALKEKLKVDEYYANLFKSLEEQRDGPATMGSMLRWNRDWINSHADYAKIYKDTRTTAETDALLARYAKELGLERRAEIYVKLNDYEAAIKDLTKVLETTKYKAEYLIKRGDVYVLIERFDRAIADYRAASAMEDDEGFQRNTDEKLAAVKRLMTENAKQPK